MLAKNLLFIGLSLLGLAGIAYSLLPANRVGDPGSFEVDWYEQQDIVDVISKVDAEFRAEWDRNDLESTPQADSLILARRLSLGLAGTIPSLEEIRALEKQPEDQRVNWWVSRLLEDRRTSDHLAERFSRSLVGVADGPFIIYRRRRFVTWLSDRLHENQPYDELATSIITGQGLWTDSPSVNFVTVTMDNELGIPDPIRLAARTSRAFLGMRIDCLQCHDDFLETMELGPADSPDEGFQTHFHELAAFYSDTKSSLAGIRDSKQTNEYQYKFLDEDKETVVQPQVPFLAELLPGKGTRRERLAAWITHPENRPFARAIVNRTWAIVCGRPLVEPIDDIPLYDDLPPGLETLAQDFVAHGYDLHRLIRIIAGTAAFARDSQADFEINREHEKHWASFPLTRLRPDQVAGAISQSTALTTIDATSHIVTQLISFGQGNEFVRRYGDAGEDEFNKKGGTVTQRLIMMNGNMLRERTAGPFNAPNILDSMNRDDSTVVTTAYLAVFSRRPVHQELEYFVAKLKHAADRTDAINDLYWVLLNSQEFAWNH